MSRPYRLPSGHWQIRWFDAAGKRQSRTLLTEEIALRVLKGELIGAQEEALRRERLGAAALTVREAFVTFMAQRQPNWDSENSRTKEYRRLFDLHIEPHLGGVRLCDLAPRVLRAWVSKLAATPTARYGETNAEGRTLSASTIRSVVVTLRQIAKASDHVIGQIEHPALHDSDVRRKERISPTSTVPGGHSVPSTMTGWVYAIELHPEWLHLGIRRLKVGWTARHISRRLLEHRTTCPNARLVGLWDATEDYETIAWRAMPGTKAGKETWDVDDISDTVRKIDTVIGKTSSSVVSGAA